MKKIIITTMLILAVSVFLPSVNAKGKKRVAVMDFTANNTSKAYARIVRNQVEVSLYKTGYFDIIERDKMDLILKEQGFQLSGCIDTTCAVEIGKLLSVHFVLVGSIDKLGKYFISIKFADVEKGLVTHADSEIAATENDIPDAITKLTYRAVAMLKGKSNVIAKTPEKKEPVKKKTNDYSNPYTFPAFGFLGLSAGSFGGAYYFYVKTNSFIDDFDSYYASYKAATNSTDATYYREKSEDAKKNADNYALYRNISYGIGAGLFLMSAYYFYKYFTYEPPAAPLKTGISETKVMPIFLTNSIFRGLSGQKSEFYFGGGVMVRF